MSDPDEGDIIFWGLVVLGGVFLYEYLRTSAATSGGASSFSPSAPQGNFLENLVGEHIPMVISDYGRSFIKKEEGLTLTIKNDAGHPEIGYGHDIQPGENIRGPINENTANAIFDNDMDETEGVLNSAIEVPVTQNQFDALGSIEFNIGDDAFRKSRLLRLLNSKDYAGASREFSKWVHSQGALNSTLVGRRGREQQMFNG